MPEAPGTGEIACYFLNHIGKTGARWVSYRLGQAAERQLPEEGIAKLIRQIED